MAKKTWSNDPSDQAPLDEFNAASPEEKRLAALAKDAESITLVAYDITSKNQTADRVVHDVIGNAYVIKPGQTRTGIVLPPKLAEHLSKGDLILEASS